jgi:hypothetical protein
MTWALTWLDQQLLYETDNSQGTGWSNADEDIVEVEPYNPNWPDEFQREANKLETALPRNLPCSIEHIGSTAVPGLAASRSLILLLRAVSVLDGINFESRLNSWVMCSGRKTPTRIVYSLSKECLRLDKGGRIMSMFACPVMLCWRWHFAMSYERIRS